MWPVGLSDFAFSPTGSRLGTGFWPKQFRSKKPISLFITMYEIIYSMREMLQQHTARGFHRNASQNIWTHSLVRHMCYSLQLKLIFMITSVSNIRATQHTNAF